MNGSQIQVTREVLASLSQEDGEVIKDCLKRLSVAIGPTHTDRHGIKWTERELHMAATGMVTFGQVVSEKLAEIGRVMGKICSRPSANENGFIMSYDDNRKIYNILLALAATVHGAVKAAENPLYIVMPDQIPPMPMPNQMPPDDIF